MVSSFVGDDGFFYLFFWYSFSEPFLERLTSTREVLLDGFETVVVDVSSERVTIKLRPEPKVYKNHPGIFVELILINFNLVTANNTLHKFSNKKEPG
jgi:hypothetical protein